MKITLLGFEPKITINKQPIDEFLNWIGEPIENYCKEENFDYNTFKKIYNNDPSVTIKELVEFAEFAVMPFEQFLTLSNGEDI